jgi:hypothetical protein
LVGTYVIITLKSFVLQRKYRTDALIIFHYIDEGVQLEKPVDAIEKLKAKDGGSAENEHETKSFLPTGEANCAHQWKHFPAGRRKKQVAR